MWGAVGKQVVADAHPLLTQLESLFGSLFHTSTAPGGVVILTPKTSAATAPVASIVAPPGNAKS